MNRVYIVWIKVDSGADIWDIYGGCFDNPFDAMELKDRILAEAKYHKSQQPKKGAPLNVCNEYYSEYAKWLDVTDATVKEELVNPDFDFTNRRPFTER